MAYLLKNKGINSSLLHFNKIEAQFEKNHHKWLNLDFEGQFAMSKTEFVILQFQKWPHKVKRVKCKVLKKRQRDIR